jgi:hypothetical protein
MRILQEEYGMTSEKIADMTTEELYESVAIMRASDANDFSHEIPAK